MRPVRRVLLVVWWFDAFGGMERHVTELARALTASGIAVTVASEMPIPATNPYRQQLESAGVRVVDAPRVMGWIDRAGRHTPRSVRWVVHRALGLLLSLGRRRRRRDEADADLLDTHVNNNLLSANLLTTLRRECRERRPDVVHVHGCRAGQAWVLDWARRQGLTTAYTEHTTIGDWGGPFFPGGPELLCRSVGAIACVSERSRSSLRAWLPQPRDIAVARHIVKTPRKGPRPPSPSYDIVSVARLEHHKGLDLLIAAMTGLPAQVSLAMAGEGPERPSLERQIERAGLTGRVRLLGQQSESEIEDLLEGARVFALPSRTEGLPLSILEAFAHSLPVVATDSGGVGELVRHGVNGLLVPPGDPVALGEALRQILGDQPVRDRLGSGARRSYETSGCDPEAVVADTMAFYRTAMEFR